MKAVAVATAAMVKLCKRKQMKNIMRKKDTKYVLKLLERSRTLKCEVGKKAEKLPK